MPNDEQEIDLADVEEVTMTSLGRLVFVDIHSRYPRSLSTDDSDTDVDDCLSLAFEDLFHMPFDIIENYGPALSTLDISHNRFSRNLQFLAEFEHLTSLNLDHNDVDSFTMFPSMPKLQLLWLNNNSVENLYPFIRNLSKSFPNLRYLCLMGNKAAPSYLNGGSFFDYLQYRLFVISWLPRLIHLDDRVVTGEQRSEARRLFKRPFLDQLADNTQLPECMKYLHSKLSDMLAKPMHEKEKKSASKNFVI